MIVLWLYEQMIKAKYMQLITRLLCFISFILADYVKALRVARSG